MVKIITGHSLEESVLIEIDRRRGLVNRSLYIELLLRHVMDFEHDCARCPTCQGRTADTATPTHKRGDASDRRD
ncbi:hypothetical protein ANME2D_02328 [Candidatus Methanoperedens nitroreducens]|uniref:Uncharacterized protein n=1 Tax=Candidatus Methanoperedens nitratireducens TaxID=1392998 RepID=A0A062V4R2_9EURY|nr:hypothetical protein [Candidatus Methanoperedens nitroreducens]KCZ71593.1 hypothetical protein ANME2D_02328 [Candidatus Methanoperedens nitroreducens]MDJ1421223.1 hypothetical protein [Candidatus Methanoperedens sp.]